MPPPPGGVRRYHVVAEQITKRRVENQPASGVEHRPDVPECIPYHQELEAIDMRPLVQEFLPQGPKVRQFRRHLDLGARRPGKMCAASAIADDPMIDGLAPDVALRAQNVNRGRNSATHRQAAEAPQSNFPEKPVVRLVFTYHLKDRQVPIPPCFELIRRVKSLG